MGPGPRVERSLRLSFKLSKDIESLKQKKNKDPYKRSFFCAAKPYRSRQNHFHLRSRFPSDRSSQAVVGRLFRREPVATASSKRKRKSERKWKVEEDRCTEIHSHTHTKRRTQVGYVVHTVRQEINRYDAIIPNRTLERMHASDHVTFKTKHPILILFLSCTTVSKLHTLAARNLVYTNPYKHTHMHTLVMGNDENAQTRVWKHFHFPSLSNTHTQKESKTLPNTQQQHTHTHQLSATTDCNRYVWPSYF